jgi:hypothetical protein
MRKDKAYYDLYCWIIRGSQRKTVLKHLTEIPITAQELRKQVNSELPKNTTPLSLREMSRQLTTFTDNKITECLSPDAPYSKPYKLTKKGIALKNELTKSGSIS